ncbi:MAG: FadR/GntR family transcriptional regulator [Eubacteriales bacterium]|nr:FadR/GntR family transcriptional regulator [Eubacteriales bacterium]
MEKTKGIHTIKRVNLYEQVADQMEKMILDGMNEQWGEGCKLPPEQELADSFGVSRNVVREALKLLKARGLVDPKNGVGVYVTKPDPAQLSALLYRFTLMDDISIQDIYDFRAMMECWSVARAAQSCSEEHLQEMRELMAKLEDTSIELNERREIDFALHMLIAKASGNELFHMMMLTLKDVFMIVIEKGIRIAGGIDNACLEHARILKAIEMHDEKEAVAAMQAHLETSKAQVQTFATIQDVDGYHG